MPKRVKNPKREDSSETSVRKGDPRSQLNSHADRLLNEHAYVNQMGTSIMDAIIRTAFYLVVV